MALTTALPPSTRTSRDLPDRRRVRVLAAIIAFTVVSTGLHYAHNYLQIEHYPPADFATNHTIQIAILISWPLLTAIGMFGLWLYSRGSVPPAYTCLIAYSVLGLVTLGHFTEGSPHIGAFWYATIFTDAIGGVALLAFVAWDALIPHSGAAPLPLTSAG